MAGKKRKAAEISIDINANVAQLAKDMKKVTAELDGFGRKIASIQKLAAASFSFDVAKSAVPYIKDIASAIGTLAEKGEKFGSIADSFAALGGSSTQIEQAKKAVLGVVDSFTLMQIANEGLLKQIPGFSNNFGKIADLGNRVADSLGIEAADGIRQVTDALGTAKEKQLAAIGITIDAEAAYKRYADSIGVATNQLSDAQKQEARQIAAIEGLDAALARLPVSTDSVANALGALQAGFTEALNQFSIGINESDELTQAFRDLGDSIGQVDWQEFGSSVARFVSIVVDAVSTALPYITDFFNSIIDGFDLVDRTILEAKANGIANSMGRARESLDSEAAIRKKVKDLKDYIDQIDSLQQKASGAKTKKDVEDLIPTLGKYVDVWKTMGDSAPAIKQKLIDVTNTIEKQREVLPEVAKIVPRFGKATASALDEQQKAAQKASKEIEKLNSSWSKYIRNVQQDAADNTELGTLSAAEFESLKAKMQDTVRQAFYEEWKDKMKLGGQHYQDVMIEAERAVNEEGKRLDAERAASQAKLDQKNRQAIDRNLSQTYANLNNITSQLGVDLSDTFNLLSTQFGDQMAKAMNSLGNAIGISGGDMAGYASIFTSILGTSLNAKKVSKSDKSEKGTGQAVGATAGAVIGGVIGSVVPVIGTMLGAALGAALGGAAGGVIGSMIKWGPQNADTKSQHVFANWLEDQLNSLQAVGLFDRNGQFRTARGSAMNFVEGDTGRFNKPGWADEMSKWGDNARTMFVGLGNALKETLGITQKVGAQIGYLLGENLAGNIDNARLLVFELGLSIDDLSEALLKMAKRGEITWGEYAAQVASLGEAFKPGLQAVGDLTGAVNELYGSGGRGMAALKAVKDIAQEAIEQGATNLDQLRQKLVQSGINPQEADAIMNSFKQQGIRTLQEVANLNEAQTGQIVAGIGAQSDAIRKKWEEVSTSLEKIKWDMDQLPTEKDIEINFKGKFDATMQKAADAGLLENGNSTLSPVDNTASTTAKNARVSASQVRMASAGAGAIKAQSVNAFSISIDARGADAGVEDKIHTIITGYQDVIAKNAASMVVDYQSRGG